MKVRALPFLTTLVSQFLAHKRINKLANNS